MRDVESGKIDVCEGVRLAIKRHKADIEKSKKKNYPYYFNESAGNRVAAFIEELPHTKGRWARKNLLIELGDWQCFIVVLLFGWLRKENNLRRFLFAYLRIPRKNGKSLLAAAIGLYMLLADDEFGAEVYSGATTEKQAWEVFRPAKQMLERTPELQEAFGADPCAKTLVVLETGSKFEPVIGNPGDGSSPSCAIVDEYHEHKTSALHDTMETGMGSREQPLLLIITTAGSSTATPCHEKDDEAVRVLKGLEENDQLFAVIYGIDPEDNWADPKSLIKANPNYDISVDGDYLLSLQRSARSNPVQQNKFKTKHLNVWCSVRAAWMPADLWVLAADTELSMDELIEKKAQWYIAFDLASKSDLCAEVMLARLKVNGQTHYYLFARYWLPEEAVDDPGPNHAHYVKWVKQGYLTQTDGATVNFEEITEQIVADVKKLNPEECVYDPFISTQVAQDIAAGGVKCLVEFTQLPHNFAVPMDEFIAALKDGRVHHDGNPITTWCFTNIAVRVTKKGLFAPIKSKPHLKIDGGVAGIMGFARATAAKDKEKAFQMLTLGN